MAHAEASEVHRQPLSAAAAVETARFMAAGPASDAQVAFSPDKSRYVIRVARGDLKNDGVWVEVLTGSASSVTAAKPVVAARLFSRGRGQGTISGPPLDSSGWASPIRWLSGNTVAFLFSNESEIRQVVVVNLDSRTHSFVTAHSTQVSAFDVAEDGTVIFAAAKRRPAPSVDPIEAGLVIPPGSDALSLVNRRYDGSSIFNQEWDSEWFVKGPGSVEELIEVGDRPFDPLFPDWHFVRLAPDGTRALLLAAAQSVPAEWDYYRASSGDAATVLSSFAAARRNPDGPGMGDIPQLYVWERTANRARPLWNAIALRNASSMVAEWAPSSPRLFLAPTPLPIRAGEDRTVDQKAAVIIDTSTGEYCVLAADGATVTSATWVGSKLLDIAIRTGGESRRGRFEASESRCRLISWSSQKHINQNIGIEVREEVNVPPKLFAVERRPARETPLYDPNPDLLSRFELGTARLIGGTLRSGAKWSGVLFLPSEQPHAAGYPLVIQSTHSNDDIKRRFSLYGSGSEMTLGPSNFATYAARVLTGRGIAVLQMDTAADYGKPNDVDIVQQGFEEAAERLVAEGIVDRERVGLLGFSRHGYFVVYTLTHSSFPFAAAEVVDNYDPSYVQTTLANAYAPAESAIGAGAFGDGLKTWLTRAPGFNAENVRTPLHFVGQSLGASAYILTQWEMYSRLRQLGCPTEMFLMPDMDRFPSHVPQNPRQIVAVQERTVDWFDFWLNDDGQPVFDGKPHFERWRALKDAAAKVR